MVIKMLPARLLSLLIGVCLLAVATWSVSSARPDEKPTAPAGGCGDSLPQGAVARLGTQQWRHASTVTFVAFAADGTELVSSCGDGIVHVWDAVTGKEMRRFGEL